MGGLFAGTYAARYPGQVLSAGLFNAAGVAAPVKSEVMKKIETGENPLVLQDEKDFLRIYRKSAPFALSAQKSLCPNSLG